MYAGFHFFLLTDNVKPLNIKYLCVIILLNCRAYLFVLWTIYYKPSFLLCKCVIKYLHIYNTDPRSGKNHIDTGSWVHRETSAV